MQVDSLARQPFGQPATAGAQALELPTFDNLFWPWQRVLRWLYFRDTDRLNEGWWHLADQPFGASSPVRDPHPNTTLMRELQTGRLRAFREGAAVPREAWAGEPLQLRFQVHFRREDVLELWPASTAASRTLSITPSPQGVTTDFRQAPEAQIRDAITAIYEEHEAGNRKPPNIREIGPLVRARLHGQCLTASIRRIGKLAGDARYKGRRLPSGKRFRPRSSSP
jgi:hypothetical protein